MRKILLALVLLAGCAAPQYREAPTEAEQAAIRPGMERAEVERLLGPPSGGTETYAGGETVSGWLLPVRFAGIRHAYFNVHYRGDKVVRTSHSFEYLSMP